MSVLREVDENDQFDWAERTTETSVVSEQTLRDVTTVFDDGRIEVENFVDDVLLQWSLTDPTDVTPLQSQRIVYDTEGVIAFTDTLDDTLVRNQRTFESGRLVGTVKTDEGDTLPWATIRTEVYFSHHTTSRETVFDDGRTRLDTLDSRGLQEKLTTLPNGNTFLATFQSGELQSHQKEDLSDSFAWETIYTRFYLNGRSERQVTADDGTFTSIRPFPDDAGRGVTIEDRSDLRDWRKRTIAYDAEGNRLHQTRTEDNGVRTTIRYRDDIETSVGQRDIENAEDWTQISFSYSPLNGISNKTIWFDNGDRLSEKTEDGVITRRSFYDDDPETPLDNLLQTFENGELTSEIYKLDNGNSRYFEDGVLRGRGIADLEDLTDWRSIYKGFDAEGNLEKKTTRYENNVVDIRTFTDGVLTEINLYDTFRGAPWKSNVATFAQDGSIEQRVILYDDGIFKIDMFENGLRTTTTRTDNDNAKAWHTSVTAFTEDGGIASRVMTFDNGVVLERSFAESVLQRTVERDLSDVFDWDFIVTEGGAGPDDEITRFIAYDDGDQVASRLQAGVAQLRIEVDISQAHEWFVRTTEFANGVPTSQTYAALNDVAERYVELLIVDELVM